MSDVQDIITAVAEAVRTRGAAPRYAEIVITADDEGVLIQGWTPGGRRHRMRLPPEARRITRGRTPSA